jgi:hypothetical protein
MPSLQKKKCKISKDKFRAIRNSMKFILIFVPPLSLSLFTSSRLRNLERNQYLFKLLKIPFNKRCFSIPKFKRAISLFSKM